MHLNNEISEWLNHPEDYFYGTSLLAKTSKKRHLLSVLQRKESPKNKAKLIYELEKCLKTQENGTDQNHQNNEKENSQHSSIQQRQQSNWRSTYSRESMPKHSEKIGNYIDDKRSVSSTSSGVDYLGVAEDIRLKRNALYAKRAHYHGQLHIAPTKPKRFKLAKEIMTIQPQIDKYNTQLAFIQTHGKLPQELSGVIVNAQTQVRINNLISYMSRYRKKIANAKTVLERDKYQEILDNYTAEYESLKY